MLTLSPTERTPSAPGKVVLLVAADHTLPRAGDASGPPHRLVSLPRSFATGVVARAHQMQRDVRLVTYDPAVVSGGNVEDFAGLQFHDVAVVHGGGGPP